MVPQAQIELPGTDGDISGWPPAYAGVTAWWMGRDQWQ